MNHIYILYSTTLDRYYMGCTQNPSERLKKHLYKLNDRYTGKTSDWLMISLFEVSD